MKNIMENPLVSLTVKIVQLIEIYVCDAHIANTNDVHSSCHSSIVYCHNGKQLLVNSSKIDCCDKYISTYTNIIIYISLINENKLFKQNCSSNYRSLDIYYCRSFLQNN